MTLYIIFKDFKTIEWLFQDGECGGWGVLPKMCLPDLADDLTGLL